jgi:hypothetical protein
VGSLSTEAGDLATALRIKHRKTTPQRLLFRRSQSCWS